MTEFSEDTIITIDDARRAGYCVVGIRRWIRDHPQLDLPTFIHRGYTVAELRKTGDVALLEHILQVKKEAEDGWRR